MPQAPDSASSSVLEIVLFEPEIPPNTGNIMRLCANMGVRLHLIEPLGFVLDDRRLRRAGMDYRDVAVVNRHASLAACRDTLGPRRWFALSRHARNRYDQVSFQAGDVLLFGPETRGLPAELLAEFSEFALTIPQQPGSRSLNLSNAVAVVAFEAWRQLGFPGAASEA